MTQTLNLSADSEKEIRADIKNVTVYPDRAQLNHECSIDLPSGKTVLKLGSLSPFIDAGSIQVKGFGDFTILSVSHRNNYLENLESIPEVKNIRSQIEALQLKVEDEKTAITVLNEKEAFLIDVYKRQPQSQCHHRLGETVHCSPYPCRSNNIEYSLRYAGPGRLDSDYYRGVHPQGSMEGSARFSQGNHIPSLPCYMCIADAGRRTSKCFMGDCILARIPFVGVR